MGGGDSVYTCIYDGVQYVGKYSRPYKKSLAGYMCDFVLSGMVLKGSQQAVAEQG